MIPTPTPPAVGAVVIGGSAGALEPLSTLLSALPSDCSIPVAIVLHLLPHAPSYLPDVLGAHTVLPVKEAEDKEPLRAGVIYVAPPDYHLLIERDRRFALSSDAPVHFSRPSIDVLFESAAEAYGERLVAVILSGASADGAQGMAAVHQYGGLALVQAPEDAAARVMPSAALAALGAMGMLSDSEMGGWRIPELAACLRAVLGAGQAWAGALSEAAAGEQV